MKIVRTLASDCANGLDCPEIHELDDGRLLVRGYTVPDAAFLASLGLPAGEAAVIITPSLLRKARP